MEGTLGILMTEFGNAARIVLVGTVLLLLVAVELQAQNAADVVNVLDGDLTTMATRCS